MRLIDVEVAHHRILEKLGDGGMVSFTRPATPGGAPRGSTRLASHFRLSVSTRFIQAWPPHRLRTCREDVRFQRAAQGLVDSNRK
jgi:hypothetical protein